MDSEHDLPDKLDHPDHTQPSTDQSGTSNTGSTQTDDDHPRIHDSVGAHPPKRANPEIYNGQLGEKLAVLAAGINAAQYQFLTVLAEFDDRSGWNCGRTRSCAHWLNWRCGISMGTAREKVRVCHALPALPLTSEAFEQGHISFSKVRALTRIATPENESTLLNIARYGSANMLEKLVRVYRKIETNEELAKERLAGNERHYARELSHYWDDDGSLVIRAKLPPEQGAVVLKALDTAYESLKADENNAVAEAAPDTATSKDPIESPEKRKARRADALGVLAGCWLDNRGSDSQEHTTKNSDRYQVVINIDADLLANQPIPAATKETVRNNNQQPEVKPAAKPVAKPAEQEHKTPHKDCTHRNVSPQDCSLEDLQALPPDTVRRLSCDCSVVAMLTKDQQPLSVGRKTRAVPPAIRRSLLKRDRGCRFPGCCATRYVDAHHIQHWANGGHTSLDNLVTLCSHHHHLVHEGGYTINAAANGEFHFYDDKNQFVDPAPPTVNHIERMHRMAFLDKLELTEDSLWQYSGDVMDYDMVLHNLFFAKAKKAKKAAEAAAEVVMESSSTEATIPGSAHSKGTCTAVSR